jgi:predicted alpha/beta hydrolase family esterase
MYMPKRIFIVHGWGGLANEGWLGWLNEQLSKDCQVFSLQMPDTETPRVGSWVKAISEAVGKTDKNTFFVGHSLGCQAIARYLQTLPEAEISGGAVFVAGFFRKLTNMSQDRISKGVISEWLDNQTRFNEINKHLLKSTAIFSDNDPYVPFDNVADFKDLLKSKIIIEHNQGHFSGSSGLPKYDVILRAVLEIIK